MDTFKIKYQKTFEIVSNPHPLDLCFFRLPLSPKEMAANRTQTFLLNKTVCGEGGGVVSFQPPCVHHAETMSTVHSHLIKMTFFPINYLQITSLSTGSTGIVVLKDPHWIYTFFPV